MLKRRQCESFIGKHFQIKIIDSLFLLNTFGWSRRGTCSHDDCQKKAKKQKQKHCDQNVTRLRKPEKNGKR